MREYRDEKYDFIITSDFFRDRYDGRKSEEADFYSSLDLEAEKIGEFGADVPFYLDDIYSPFWNLYKLDSPGPRIRI